METFIQQVNQFTPLSKTSILELYSLTTTNAYKKGEAVLELNRVAKKIYYIETGVLKVSFLSEGKEFVMKFFSAQ